jgi:hypothetical protein
MGPEINTAYDEQSPFIHPDDSTFYFCSNGWPGMGGRDLFISRMAKDGKWQKPVNLGYPINSNGDENGFTLTANGAYAFFSSNNLNGFGGYDIYTFRITAKPEAQHRYLRKGQYKDIKTRCTLRGHHRDHGPGEKHAGVPGLQQRDGRVFSYTLAAGKNYGLNISRQGYLFYSDNFSLIGHKEKQPSTYR